MPRLPILPITLLVSSNSKIVCGGTPKKPGPWGPGFSDCRRGGRQCLPEGNMLPCRRFWEDIHPAKQCTTSMRSVLHSGNVGRRMTAMRNRNSSESDDFHHLVSRLAKILLHLRWESQKCQRWAFATRKSRKT